MATNQRRHRSQMTPAEVEETEVAIRVRSYILVCHARARAEQWRVDVEEIEETIKHGEVIEVHVNAYPDVRVLLRQDFGCYSVCVVVSLMRQQVVTVFVNLTEDKHHALDHSQYQWKGSIEQSVRLGKAQ